MNLIYPNDFCEVVTDKFVNEGVKRGHIVYVAGHKALPIAENDPYTQRIKFFVHLTDNELIVYGPLYLMDPDSLQKIDDNKQKHLHAINDEADKIAAVNLEELEGDPVN